MTKRKLKYLIIMAAVMAVFLSPLKALAHPGNTASDGCHYCRTNCTSWGEVYGTRHCHGGGYSAPTIPTIPTCPSMSSYNSLSGQCECIYGYVSSGGSCISRDQYCRNNYGYSSRYSVLEDSCECSYGYILTNGSCTDADSYCRGRLGFNSKYNDSREVCECKYDYVFNSSGSRCISRDEACQDQFGIMSRSNYSDQCECVSGYHFEGNNCVIDEIESSYVGTYSDNTTPLLIEDIQEDVSTSKSTPSPSPIFKPKPSKLPSTISSPNPSSNASPSVMPSTNPEVLGEDAETSPGGAVTGLTVFGLLGYVFWRAIKQKWPFNKYV